MEKIYGTGLRWSGKDHRDKMYSVSQPVPLPPEFDFQRPVIDWMYNQSTTSSCTAQAAVSLERIVNKKVGMPLVIPSRLFLYWIERKLEGHVELDDGAMIRSSMKVMANWGVCPEEMFPFTDANMFAQPSEECFRVAVQNMVKIYMRIDRQEQKLKQCLVDGFPFVFGVNLYSSIMGDETARTGVIQMPTAQDKIIGGHAVLGVGYTKTHYIFMNSWGPKWGDQGYGYLPQEVMHSELCDDFFTVRQMEPLDPMRKYKTL
jgi:C1A family cysteine protease